MPRLRRHLPLLLVLWTGALTGSATAADLDPPLDPAAACLDWRWIGIRAPAESECPQAAQGSGWVASSLFDLGDGSPIPPGLAGFCLYEHPVRGDAQRLLDLAEQGRLLEVAQDCAALASSASELASQVWQPFAAQLLAQAGQVALPLVAGAAPVRLAVLDTAATDELDPGASPGNSPHGYTLVNVAQDLLCPPAGCLAEITTQLALPYLAIDPQDRRRSQRDVVDGGYVGTIGELAQAMRREVKAWSASGARRLVLNLSVAWDPRFGGFEPAPQDMPPSVEAVYRAVEDASCRGALVVAAAGNLFGGPEVSVGPLLPAAWEARRAPGGLDCLAALEVPPDPADFPPPGQPVYRPLLHAAGGMSGAGEPLANARAGGEPRLAAFADHAVVEGAVAGEPTATLTGTSVAALVVSSSAAAAWYYEPGLRADQVVTVVHRGGEALGRQADFCLGGTPARPCPLSGAVVRVRRVSVCRAARESCRSGTRACPATVAFPPCPSWPAPVPDLSGVTLPAAIRVDLADLTAIAPADPDCGLEVLHHDPAYVPVDPCPQHQFYDLALEAWVGPQPGSNPCPNCTGVPPPARATPITLLIEIDADFDGLLSDPTLKIGENTYNLSIAPLAAGDQVEVTGVDPAGRSDLFVAFTLTRGAERQSVLAPVAVP